MHSVPIVHLLGQCTVACVETALKVTMSFLCIMLVFLRYVIPFRTLTTCITLRKNATGSLFFVTPRCSMDAIPRRCIVLISTKHSSRAPDDARETIFHYTLRGRVGREGQDGVFHQMFCDISFFQRLVNVQRYSTACALHVEVVSI